MGREYTLLERILLLQTEIDKSEEEEVVRGQPPMTTVQSFRSPFLTDEQNTPEGMHHRLDVLRIPRSRT